MNSILQFHRIEAIAVAPAIAIIEVREVFIFSNFNNPITISPFRIDPIKMYGVRKKIGVVKKVIIYAYL